MDINLDYSDDENPITLKSDFILSLCDLIIGGKEGLSPIERTIIDRCTRLVYRESCRTHARKYADLRRSLRAAFETV